MDDLRAISAKTGWTVDEARENVRRHALFGQLVASLNGSVPAQFAGGWGENASYEGRFVVRLVGDVPAAARELAERLGLAVEFRGGARASLASLEKQAAEISEELRRQGLRVAAAVWPQDESIRVTVTRPERRTAADVLAALPAGVKLPGVAVSVVEPPTQRLAEITYGGGFMFQNTTFLCTSGFVVRDATMTGVTTAGHCPGINRYRDGAGNEFATQFRNAHEGWLGDVEWHATPTSATVRQFYSGPSAVREVQRVQPEAEITAGEWVCVYGRATNYLRCETVQHPNMTCTNDIGIAMNNMVVMNAHITTGGDSGAPWHYGNEAFGGHYGQCVEMSNHSTFTKADRFDHAIGAEVMSRDRWVRGEEWTSANAISPDGRFTFAMQSDGNLVLYQAGVGPIWATSWLGVPMYSGSRIAMQGDGNLVLYAPWGAAIWSTATNGRPGSQVVVQSDGNVVIYDVDRIARWSTGTCCR